MEMQLVVVGIRKVQKLIFFFLKGRNEQEQNNTTQVRHWASYIKNEQYSIVY